MNLAPLLVRHEGAAGAIEDEEPSQPSPPLRTNRRLQAQRDSSSRRVTSALVLPIVDMGATTNRDANGNPALSPVVWVALACAACCLGPLMAIAGVGTTLTGVALFVDPWFGVGVGAFVLGVVGYLFIKRLGRNVKSPEGSSSTTGTVCRLPPSDRAQRSADFRRLFENTLLDRTRDGHNVLWTLRATPVSERESHRLASLETRCCDGIQFDVRGEEDEIVWRITGPPAAAAVLDAFYELPVLVTTERANELWTALDRATCGGVTTR